MTPEHCDHHHVVPSFIPPDRWQCSRCAAVYTIDDQPPTDEVATFEAEGFRPDGSWIPR